MIIFLYCYAGAILLFLFSWFGYQVYLYYKYTDENGWHKCHTCGKAPPDIYYTNKWWGTMWECAECAFRKDQTKKGENL